MLLSLSVTKETNLNNLIRSINSTYNQVSRNLQILEKEGIVRITQIGRAKLISLQMENEKTLALLKALRTLDRASMDS